MEARAAKLALARKKLRDHQEKKVLKEEVAETNRDDNNLPVDHIGTAPSDNSIYHSENILQYKQNSFGKEDQQVKIPQALSRDDMNVTEILISDKRDLELQVVELQKKLYQSESNQNQLMNNYDDCKQQLNNLETHLTNLNDKYLILTKDLSEKNDIINDLRNANTLLTDQNNTFVEQLDFTKTLLKSKESENASLQNHLFNVQSQLEVTQLQLQQLTDGAYSASHDANTNDSQNIQVLTQKINNLEQQLTLLQKEKDQTKLHYENYVTELNDNLKAVITKNEKMVQEIQSLSNRENHLIEQISEMEIRLQNYHKCVISETKQEDERENEELITLKKSYEDLEAKYKNVSAKYEEIQIKHKDCENKLVQMSQYKSNEPDDLNISLTKLNADIASDKVAVQRATEQNRQLKKDLQELEDTFVKISKDKLELTEKLDAEKFLNRELTIKLAEINEKAKDYHTKLVAKDEEMIRLQTSYKEIKAYLDRLSSDINDDEDQEHSHQNVDVAEEVIGDDEHNHLLNNNEIIENKEEPIQTPPVKEKVKVLKEDAMLKLQDRFLKIMDEVANLSDEKSRLEHIILQLQNETDTICEYVALYQQQRSLLKKKDEERSAQIKLFQSECLLLKNQLEEVINILSKWAVDKDFQDPSKRNDVVKVIELLNNLRNSVILDNKRSCTELQGFYPCSCCSGQLIDV